MVTVRGWTGGWGRGRGKGVGDGGRGGGGRWKRGDGREVLGAGLYKILLYFTDFTLYLCTSMQ